MAGDELVAYGFDPAAFRDAIHLAMRMGSPNLTADKATFRWDRARTFAPEDPSNKPYNWQQVAVTDLTQPDVVLDEVAVEYAGGARITNTGTSVGDFVPRRAELTILDDEHVQVVGANWVLLHEIPWAIIDEVVVALGSVDVYTMTLAR